MEAIVRHELGHCLRALGGNVDHCRVSASSDPYLEDEIDERPVPSHADLFTAGVLCWLLYGIWIDSLPILITNAVTFLLAGANLALKIRYG